MVTNALNPTAFSDEAWVTLLLCSRLGWQKGAAGEPEPLRDAAWHALRTALEQEGQGSPDMLLGRNSAWLQGDFRWNLLFADQVAALLDEARRERLAVELTKLADRGIWVLTWDESAYPQALKQRLGPKAPALLYGAGPQGLLGSRGVAIVGSRHLSPEDERFAGAAGSACAEAGLAVFSGAAWGADRVAMQAALAAGGRAVGVVAGRLASMLRDTALAPLIAGGRLALVSKVLPAAPFTIGNAMDRNKLIYCLAEQALVVTSALKTGGTWQGATENLRRNWVPLLVRTGADTPAGNEALLDLGAQPVTLASLAAVLAAPSSPGSGHVPAGRASA